MVLESAKNGDIANINEHIATSASIFWVFTTVEDSPSSHMSTCPRTSLWTSFHMHRLFHGDVRLDGSEFPRMGSTPLTANIHKPSSKPTANHRFPHRQDRVVRSLLPGPLPTRPAALRGRRAVAHRAADAKQVAGRVDGLGGGLCAGRAQEAGWGGENWGKHCFFHGEPT